MPTRGVIDTSVLRGRDQETFLSKSVAGAADVTLTADEALANTIKFTGALTGSISVIFPVSAENAGMRWWIENGTTEAFTLTVKKSGGTGAAITQAKRALVVWDGEEFRQYTADAAV